jgi:hypothetical protein
LPLARSNELCYNAIRGRDRLQSKCASLLWPAHFFAFQEVNYETDKQIGEHGNAQTGNEPGAAADDLPAGTIPL